jgi:hypothetical protein
MKTKETSMFNPICKFNICVAPTKRFSLTVHTVSLLIFKPNNYYK